MLSFVDSYFVSTDSFDSFLLLISIRWTIRARVTNKSSVRTWSNSRGEGKLFSFEIVDESVSKGVVRPAYLSMCMHVNTCHTWLYLLLPGRSKKLSHGKCARQQGEIKITAFNDEVDKFFSLVEQGKVSKSHSPSCILTRCDKSFFET